MNFWLVKSEPDTYSWDTFVSKSPDIWDGVRNYQARNNLMSMQKGDRVFFYHSNIGLEIVGIAEVAEEHFPDPTATEGKWVVVRLKPYKKLKQPVSLKTIKADPNLADIALLKQSRLSVVPIRPEEYTYILGLANEN